VAQRGDDVGGSRARAEAPGSGTRYPGAASAARVSWPNGEAVMAGLARRGDGGLQYLGEVQSEGRVRPTVEVEAERGSGCQRANGRGQRELGCSRGRGRGGREATHAGRLTDDARKTGTWDGRWRLRDDRTADYSYLLNK
jgi:hypothetical protein